MSAARLGTDRIVQPAGTGLPRLAGQTGCHSLELAGAERTSINDVLDRLSRITEKTPLRIPLPSWIAEAGTRVAGAFGLDLPVNVDQLQMLVEGNVISPGQTNALVTTLWIVYCVIR